MNYGDKVKKNKFQEIWTEYCNFLDLSIDDYMMIQNRLMKEQIFIWASSGIGKKFLSEVPASIEEFRSKMPLTSYEDYADVLLGKKEELLPSPPAIWLQTTWEGGRNPIKVAPYTQGMLDTFRDNLMSVSTLSACDEHHKTKLKHGDRALFGLAPLPYVTGLFPLVFKDELDLHFLPPVKEAHQMSFGERNKLGFSLGMEQGIDVFFGMSSVINYISMNFGSMVKGGGSSSKKLSKITKMSPKMVYRFLSASYTAKKEDRDILPKDIFKLKSLVCAGTDTASYKENLKQAWGIDPLEIFAGTEVSLVGTETLSRNGLVFFPDNCFYEFIPEEDLRREKEDPSFVPRTFLMNELVPNHNYELAITTLKGGAFARYRVGDMFRCISTTGDSTTSLPMIVYVDRVPDVIDIAGFTRITEKSIAEVIQLSGLPIRHWIAKKEYDFEKRPFLHLYIEMESEDVHLTSMSKQLIKEHMEIYFKHYDTDYNDLKKMLGIEPLQVDILKFGTVDGFYEKTGKTTRRINPSEFDLHDLLEYGAFKRNI